MSTPTIISEPALLQSFTEGQLAAAGILASAHIERSLPTSRLSSYLTPSKAEHIPSKTNSSQANTAVLLSEKQSRSVNCDKATRKTQSVCAACHQDQALDGDVSDDIPRLYSHLCRAAAIMSAILPCQQQESNEKYIQRLLNEADKTEAASKNNKVEITPAKAAEPIRKLKETRRAKSASCRTDPRGMEDPGFGMLVDSEGEPYVKIEVVDPGYSDHEGNREVGLSHRARGTLEDEDVERCPVCDWKLMKDKCMRCGYLVGGGMDEESSENDGDPLSVMFDKLEKLIHGR